jgi:hypothetical protein
MTKLGRTERTKAEVLRSLRAINRRTETALCASRAADLGLEVVRALAAAKTLAEIFASCDQAMTMFHSDSAAAAVADALSTILGRPFHVIHDPRMGDLGQYSIGEGAR